jgi:hypothetical protein
MANKKYTKNCNFGQQKHYTENKELSNTNPSKNWL